MEQDQYDAMCDKLDRMTNKINLCIKLCKSASQRTILQEIKDDLILCAGIASDAYYTPDDEIDDELSQDELNKR